MSEQLQSMIQARSDAIAGRLDAIVGKIDTLEEKFDTEMAKIPVDIKRRGEELTTMLVRDVYTRTAVCPWREVTCGSPCQNGDLRLQQFCKCLVIGSGGRHWAAASDLLDV